MESGLVKIFTASNVQRLQYIAEILLNDILGLSWEIVTDKRKLGKHPVINYSDESIPGAFHISPSPLLFESGIESHEINVTQWKDLPVFFQVDQESDFPFDIFAASFYLVTRYEEYGIFIPDKYGRFRSSESLAYKNDFLKYPVIEFWAKELANSLVRRYRYLAFKRSEYKALLTVDVDEPFAFREKSFTASVGRFFNDLIAWITDTSHRFDFLNRREEDPYNVFDYIIDVVIKNQADTGFFIPVGNHSEYENNPSWKNKEYKKLILKISDKFNIGIHPSFRASANLAGINREINRLRTVTGKNIQRSRFHFLKLVFPESYRNLNAVGISEDYSMGYSDEPGFRAGIARPFKFYDILEDKITKLRIFPFQIMDVTFTGSKKVNPDTAQEIIKKMILQTKKAGGVFVSIWHNTSLLETPEFEEWRKVFEFTLAEQMP